MSRLGPNAIRRGDVVQYEGSQRTMTVIRGRILRLADGMPLARWIQVRDDETGGQFLAHPDNLVKVEPRDTRSYSVGATVIVTVHPDNSVTYGVDLSEVADDLHEGAECDDDLQPYDSDERIDADADLINLDLSTHRYYDVPRLQEA